MNLHAISSRTRKTLLDNSPALLTGLGVTGTLTVAYLTGKASFKAARIIERENSIHGVFEDPREKFKNDVKLVWRLYIPAVAGAITTCGCIIMANRIGMRRAAAVAAAYSISEKAIAEYKEKVVEKLGENKERELRDEIAQEQVTRNPASDREVIVAGSGEVLCYEAFTGRYFKSDMETLKKAQNDVNYLVLNDSYASLTDFYNRIDLPPTSYSDDIGWNTDELLELEFSTVLSEDGRPCISMGFKVSPVSGFYRVH